MFERRKNLLKSYFKKIVSIYCLETKNQITKYKFSELMELPLVISDRFWNIIITKADKKDELKVEEYSKEIELLPKNLVINSLIDFYTYIVNNNSDFLLEFLDIDNKGVLIKSDVKYILRNIYVFQNKTINNFNEKINTEIKKIFNKSKILLKKEYNEIFSDSLKRYLINYLTSIKLFKNFEFIEHNCQIFFCNENCENSYLNNISNMIIYLEINKGNNENNNYNNNRINDESDTKKIKRKKESFQLEQNNPTRNDEEKHIKIYNESENYCFNKNFFCFVNQCYYIYKFFIYEGYIFYFKLNPKNYLFIFDGIIIISNTHMKSKTIIVEGTDPPLYKSSIVSHVCFDNISTDIYSYEIQDIKDFSLEIKKYSKYKKFKDNYNIIKIIGEGHFSKVYMVENNNKIYAAKIIDKDTVLEDNKNISMEIWEKNIFHYIKYSPNENIVKSIEYLENSENIYFIFEYLPDGILNSFDSNIIKEIYNGLLYLKRNGIIHRDIKAKNIMMNNGHPLIIDFGLSKIQSKNSLSYESYGTLTYIAPEIFENYGYNHKCDVWSFGIMLHCLKYGEVPFISEDDDKTKTVNKILEEKYEKKNDTIYDDLIEICLEKRNGSRKKISELIPWINHLS